MICNDCDHTIFQDYENCQNLKCLKKNNVVIYGEIALKNLLKSLYKRCLEVAQYEQISKKIHQEIDNLDDSLYNKSLKKFGEYIRKKQVLVI